MIFREQAKGLYLRLRTVNNLVEASIALGVSPAAIKGRVPCGKKIALLSGNNVQWSKIPRYFRRSFSMFSSNGTKSLNRGELLKDVAV